MSDESPFLTTKQLAARWQCSTSHVDRRRAEGSIAYLCIGTGNPRNKTRRLILFRLQDVIASENRRLTTDTPKLSEEQAAARRAVDSVSMPGWDGIDRIPKPRPKKT